MTSSDLRWARGALAVLVLASAWLPVGTAETLNVSGTIGDLVARDLDGDGVREILVAHSTESDRSLSIFRKAGTEYSGQPARTILLKPDAIAFTLGQYSTPVESPAGESRYRADLALLARGGVYLYPFRSPDPDAGIRRLSSCRLFFMAPHPRRCPFWPGWHRGGQERLDLDGDGLDDLVLPEPDGLRLAYQTRDASGVHFERQDVLDVRYFVPEASTRRAFERNVDVLIEDRGYREFLSTRGLYPFPSIVDFNGDGRLDVIVLGGEGLLEIYVQRPEGRFSSAPSWRVPAAWSERATGATFADVDADGDADLVVLRIPKATDSRVLIFRHDAEDVPQSFSVPAQTLRVDGVVAEVRLADADADGRTDLLLPSYRLDLLRAAGKRAVDEIEITHLIYPGEADTPFARRPAYRRAFALPVRALREGTWHPYLITGSDVTGDAVPDLVQVDADRRLRVYRGVGAGQVGYEELRVFAEAIGEPDRILVRPLDDEPAEAIFLVYERQILLRRAGR